MVFRSIFLLFVYSMTLIMQAFFRALAAIFNSAAPATTVAGLSILMLTLYTGYSIPQPSMIGALRWITYINVRNNIHSIVYYPTHTFETATQIWVRGIGRERVPRFYRRMCCSCPSRRGLRRNHYRKPSVYHGWIPSSTSYGQR